MEQEKIVIIGFGWVGQANALALIRMGCAVAFYDVVIPTFHYAKKYQALYDRLVALSHPLEHDSPETVYIVCIGDRVSEEGVQDISLIERALMTLRGAKGRVVLRSTILPEHLQRLPFEYYVPEFLHELKAVEECINPHYFVVGVRDRKKELPRFLKEWERRARSVFYGTAEEASYVKYLSNIWNAVRIAFVNEFGDSIADPSTVGERERIERIMDFILEKKSYVRYGTSFGGHCLPKDLRAYVRFRQHNGRSVPMMAAAYQTNLVHKKIEETYHTLPQWFSFWENHGLGFRSGSVIRNTIQKVFQHPLVRYTRRQLQPLRRWCERLYPATYMGTLKKSWDALARRNAFYYSNPDTPSGAGVDEFELRETGRSDYDTYVKGDEELRRLLGEASQKIVAEIGSGVGRMTEFFVADFASVHAIDVSPVMLAIAKKRLLHLPSIHFHENTDADLPLETGKIDFVFSYLVFRHLPDERLVEGYLREIARVLTPAGVAKIQVRTGPDVYRWRWFHGVSVAEEKIRVLSEAAGLRVVKIEKENTKSMWIVVQKNNQ